MGPAVVVGNAPSRFGCDLEQLRGLATVMGCNAIYRDHPWVDFVGCVDDGMAEELRSSGYPIDRLVIRYRFEEKRQVIEQDGSVSRIVRDRNFATGPMMVSFAAERGHAPIYLVGMDASHLSIYAGTANYDSPNEERAAREDAPSWVGELRRVVREHPEIGFRQVGPELAGLPSLRWCDMLLGLHYREAVV